MANFAGWPSVILDKPYHARKTEPLRMGRRAEAAELFSGEIRRQDNNTDFATSGSRVIRTAREWQRIGKPIMVRRALVAIALSQCVMANEGLADSVDVPSETASSLGDRADAVDTSPIKSSVVSSDTSPQAIAIAKKQGATTAARDIKAGRLRILYFGKPWPPNKPRVDDTTEYPIMIVGGCIVGQPFVAEVAAYNRAMRGWHAGKAKRPPQENR